LALFTVASVAVVLIRLIRPFKVVRFGPLVSNRLGHFAGNTEIFLSEQELEMHGKGTVEIFYHITPVCNQQLAKMWERVLHVSRTGGYIDRVNRWLPGGDAHVIPWRKGDRDINGVFAKTSPHLSFTESEEAVGQEGLLELGIPAGAPFVCLHSRDSVYLTEEYPDLDMSYHDYRDSSISNFLPAAKELVQRGYYVVRTGAVVKYPISEPIPGVIDYATSNRSEFMDIYLGANCSFYLGDSCGYHAIPMIFRRPLAIVNMVPIEHAPTWMANCPFIPKKHWSVNENRVLTFKEILESGAGKYLKASQFQQAGIEVFENTPEEITAIAVEMTERLAGTWQFSDEDDALQRRFWDLWEPNELNHKFVVRIGIEYLRQNADLLE
jgi:putative glycosyltransferase (TIGR04372 family)